MPRALVPIVAFGLFAAAASAADLSFSSSTPVLFTSSGITMTISAGSNADSLQVNSTSAVLTVPALTFFQIVSTSTDITVSGLSGGALTSLSCDRDTGASTFKVLITNPAAETFTLAPSADACVAPPFPTIHVPASSYLPITSSTPAGASSTPSSASPSAPTSSVSFTPNTPLHLVPMSYGSRGESVRQLQEFLARDLSLYPEGSITGWYGPATLRAVRRFQERHGIARRGQPGYGSVGPATRKKIEELTSADASPSVSPQEQLAALQQMLRTLQDQLAALLQSR